MHLNAIFCMVLYWMKMMGSKWERKKEGERKKGEERREEIEKGFKFCLWINDECKYTWIKMMNSVPFQPQFFLSQSSLSLSSCSFFLSLSLSLSFFLLWVSCLPLLKAGFFISEYFSVTAMSILCSTFILFVDFSAARFPHFLSLSLSLFLPYQKVRKEILTTDIQFDSILFLVSLMNEWFYFSFPVLL